MPGRGSAPGKVILAGEHAVVYGHPAVAFAIDRRTEVRLEPIAEGLELDVDIDDPRLVDAVRAVIGEGWRVHIGGNLPTGRGLGSSAALSVALARAIDAPDPFQAAMAGERLFHGNPSGVDVAVAVHGGVVRYQKHAEPMFVPLGAPDWQVVLIDTGESGDTRALVAGVAAQRPGIDGELDAIGQLVDQVVEHLDDPVALGPLLTENHALLRAIGVSTPQLDGLVEACLDAGALGAKLSGAGGGGVLLALVDDDPAPLLRVAQQAGLDAWSCRPALHV